jgi:hypothetical protein
MSFCRLFADVGGGTRTPDTRIMIGALALVFAAFEAGFVGLSEVQRGQICGVGDTVRDMLRCSTVLRVS